MDMYKIICPYCHAARYPEEFGEEEKEGYHALVCMECHRPFVNQTTYTLVFQSYALVGVEAPTLPTPEEIEEDAKYYNEHPEELEEVEKNTEPSSLNDVPWAVCPEYPNSLYRFDSEFVEVKYKTSAPVKTTWSDIHSLCEEDKHTASIKELLGTDNTNKVAAVNAFVRAVKEGKVSE